MPAECANRRESEVIDIEYEPDCDENIWLII